MQFSQLIEAVKYFNELIENHSIFWPFQSPLLLQSRKLHFYYHYLFANGHHYDRVYLLHIQSIEHMRPSLFLLNNLLKLILCLLICQTRYADIHHQIPANLPGIQCIHPANFLRPLWRLGLQPPRPDKCVLEYLCCSFILSCTLTFQREPLWLTLLVDASIRSKIQSITCYVLHCRVWNWVSLILQCRARH